MVLLVKLPEKFTCWQVYSQLLMPCTSVFQATNLIHGYMTLWTTNLINATYKIDNIFIIWFDVENDMVLYIFTIMR